MWYGTRQGNRFQKGKGLVVNRIVITVCRGNMVQCVVVCGEFWAKKTPLSRGLGLSVWAIIPELKTFGVFVAPIVVGVNGRAGFYWFNPENARGFSTFDLPEKQVRQVRVREFKFNHGVAFHTV